MPQSRKHIEIKLIAQQTPNKNDNCPTNTTVKIQSSAQTYKYAFIQTYRKYLRTQGSSKQISKQKSTYPKTSKFSSKRLASSRVPATPQAKEMLPPNPSVRLLTKLQSCNNTCIIFKKAVEVTIVSSQMLEVSVDSIGDIKNTPVTSNNSYRTPRLTDPQRRCPPTTMQKKQLVISKMMLTTTKASVDKNLFCRYTYKQHTIAVQQIYYETAAEFSTTIQYQRYFILLFKIKCSKKCASV
eukprot:TRINITY_DN19765_c0_g1_i1.p2 TRINITY_DN19765_c0_g1~~TRINITY_DN19765_c0_g1_i1.p2  ORF type:complete len:247 (+),score=8.62 TRINITY_DN19765_c0_g1_i1:24-743(+)